MATGLSVADVVILNPGEIKGQVAFNDETFTQYTVRASSPDGLSAQKSFTTTPYSLIVESGHHYATSIDARLVNETAPYAQLQIYKNNQVLVDNQVGPTTVDFSFLSTKRIQHSISVTGGTISRFDIYASASDGEGSYSAYNSRSIGTPHPTSIPGWMAMVPAARVTLYGTVYLTLPDGTQLSRSLETRTVDLLHQAPASVSWQFDFSSRGQLVGAVRVAPATRLGTHSLSFRGTSPSSTGINGSRSVPTNGDYSVELPSGTYELMLRTYFTSPSQYSDSKPYSVTITPGTQARLDFTESLGTAHSALDVGGFFSNTSLSNVSMHLQRMEPGVNSYGGAWSSAPTNGQFVFQLNPGTWKKQQLTYQLFDTTHPLEPLGVTTYRGYYTQGGGSPTNVPAGATVGLETESVTLVRSKAYFDVKEALPDSPQILVSNPRIELSGTAYNPNGTPRDSLTTIAQGSSTPASVSGLTMAVEPGAYNMIASATVLGSVVQFVNQPITFASPTAVGAGAGVSTTPVENPDLKVTVKFDEVETEGVISVVETPLGPLPPQGLKSFCSDGASAEGIECSPLYYDIDTTAGYEGEVTVCIRRKFQGANGLSMFLRLYHFNSEAPPAGQWEELPPPPGMEPAIDCGADLAACGCVSEESCGIDYNADPPVSVIQVCGVTSSFSPFGIFEKDIEFTNQVDGHTYEGPTGPPALQTWKVPATGTYRITAIGASGATPTQAQGVTGGCGARMSGEFSFQGNEIVKILVGQKGTATPLSGGGGGGSFVTKDGTNPLLVAGGGGGLRSGATVNGRPGGTTFSGSAGSVSAAYTSGFVPGGVNGLGGSRVASYGAGGGGWDGDGAADGNYGLGGSSFKSGGSGGLGKTCGAPAHGGYGGGGAGNGCYGGGGGGGYSGGGGGRVGGGGSWNETGTKPSNESNVCTPSGHGRVTIEFVHP
ncbi:endo-1,C4-beta-glucanase [Myxococcus sp. QH3KD-4-1]|nr:endo-1,C4-beta-glucanase [Myxococcus qinghaiensis]